MFCASNCTSLISIALKQVPESSPLHRWEQDSINTVPIFGSSEKLHEDRAKQAIREFEKAFLEHISSHSTPLPSVSALPIRSKALSSNSQSSDDGDRKPGNVKMQAAHLGLSRALSHGNQIPPENSGPLEQSKKRQRNKTASPERPTPTGKKAVKRPSKKPKGKDSDLQFACPFCKHDSTTYGGENGCASWVSPNIETVVRHHVLDKHRMLNKELEFIDDAVFENVKALKTNGLKAKLHGSDKAKRAEEYWKAVYMTLFDAEEDEVPDPYFRPKIYGLDVHSIEKLLEKHVKDDPSLITEGRQLAHEIEQLKLERDYEEKVFQTATEEEAALKSKLSEVRIRRLAEIKRIETESHAQIVGKQSKLWAIIQSRPGGSMGARGSSSQSSNFDDKAKTEPLPGVIMDPSSLTSPDSHHRDIASSSWTGDEEARSSSFFYESTSNDPRFHQGELSSDLQDDPSLDWGNLSY